MIDPIVTVPAFTALERTINLALAMAPEVQQELADHQGKMLCLKCHSPDITMVIELGSECRVLHDIGHATDDQQLNAGLEGDFRDWLAFATSDDKVSELINGNLKLSGNSKWLIQLGDALSELDIDWEGQLANVIGDVPAHLAGRGGKFISETVVPAMQNAGQRLQSEMSKQLDRILQAKLAGQPDESDINRANQQIEALQKRILDIQKTATELLGQKQHPNKR